MNDEPKDSSRKLENTTNTELIKGIFELSQLSERVVTGLENTARPTFSAYTLVFCIDQVKAPPLPLIDDLYPETPTLAEVEFSSGRDHTVNENLLVFHLLDSKQNDVSAAINPLRPQPTDVDVRASIASIIFPSKTNDYSRILPDPTDDRQFSDLASALQKHSLERRRRSVYEFPRKDGAIDTVTYSTSNDVLTSFTVKHILMNDFGVDERGELYENHMEVTMELAITGSNTKITFSGQKDGKETELEPTIELVDHFKAFLQHIFESRVDSEEYKQSLDILD